MSEEFDSRLYVHNLPEGIRAQISRSKTNLPSAIENFVGHIHSEAGLVDFTFN